MTTSDAEALKEEGLGLFKGGDYDRALAKFELSADAFAAVEDELGQAEMLNNIGVIHRLRGRPQAAVTVLDNAEKIFARLDEKNQLGQVLANLGDVHAANRDKAAAARCYSEAAATFAKDDDVEKQSQVLRALSLMRLRQGRWLGAMMHMEESLRVRPRISLPQRLFRGLLRFVLSLLAS
jgi:tetratricopeptide (TPR) repeat protein